MKMKDIQVGEVYAIGAPNSHYSLKPARIVKVGVYGQVSTASGWNYMSSSRPTYVEIEAPSPKKHLPGFPISIDTKTDKPVQRFDEATAKIRKAYRIPAAHVQRLWSEQEKIDKAKKIAEAEGRARREEQEKADARLASRLQDFGVDVQRWSGKFELYRDEAQKVADLLDLYESTIQAAHDALQAAGAKVELLGFEEYVAKRKQIIAGKNGLAKT